MTSLPEIETAWLRLRAYEQSDVPELTRLIGAREVAATTLRIPHPHTEQDARDFLANSADRFRFAITWRSEGRLCGGIGLVVEEQHQRAELGYWIGVPFWGKGCATEAAQAVLRYGFGQLDLHRVFATHFNENSASGRVLKKLGMTRDVAQPRAQMGRVH
jgi:[ribosomal protein S5]-alanine N-acetyltransferase